MSLHGKSGITASSYTKSFEIESLEKACICGNVRGTKVQGGSVVSGEEVWGGSVVCGGFGEWFAIIRVVVCGEEVT